MIKSKWKRFWMISLNIWANIVVTKHVLLAAEFITYRPRLLLGFHSLHVNAMKCIYVGFSLSILQSFFWKISLNSRLIRLEGFNNKISIYSLQFLDLQIFFSVLLAVPQKSFARSCDLRISGTAQNLLFSGDFTKRLMYWKCHVHDPFSHFGIRKENSAFTIR